MHSVLRLQGDPLHKGQNIRAPALTLHKDSLKQLILQQLHAPEIWSNRRELKSNVKINRLEPNLAFPNAAPPGKISAVVIPSTLTEAAAG